MKKKVYQRKKNYLEGDELLKIEELIEKGIFITFREETNISIFYRCRICRKSTLRYEKNTDKFFKTKGHSHHCLANKMSTSKKLKNSHEILFKICKVTDKEVNDFQISFQTAMDGRSFMDDNIIYGEFLEEPTTYLEEFQTLTKVNEEIFLKFKKRSRQKIYAPVIIEKDPVKGFLVRATSSIPALSLICEYSGQILKYDPNDPDFDFSKADSLMDYVSIEDRDYVIYPSPCCNLGRFINGINNSTKSHVKMNVKSMAFQLEGKIHVVLYARRKINKGEELMYNYNAGRLNEYDTSKFK
jgi:hypothetical protein